MPHIVDAAMLDHQDEGFYPPNVGYMGRFVVWYVASQGWLRPIRQLDALIGTGVHAQ
jgi:hypothetical protein